MIVLRLNMVIFALFYLLCFFIVMFLIFLTSNTLEKFMEIMTFNRKIIPKGFWIHLLMKSTGTTEGIMVLPYCLQYQVYATGSQADGYYLVDTINVCNFLWTDCKQTNKTLFNFINVLQSLLWGKRCIHSSTKNTCMLLICYTHDNF